MIEIFYLAHNRLEFTKASIAALIANTNWSKVSKLVIYDDGSTDGTAEFLARRKYPVLAEMRRGIFRSPVNIMNDYLFHSRPAVQIFCKLDSDTMVPPGWLDDCRPVMSRHPELGLLGIEAFNPVAPPPAERSYTPAVHIGGIGMMRTEAFMDPMIASRRFFGFTSWQTRHEELRKGWVNPSLPVFLLDHLPREPWRSLTREYIAKGWQREWGPYDEKSSELWSWWCA